MSTPEKSKLSYEITGLLVRTSPEGEIEILIEHEGAWRVAFGRQSDWSPEHPVRSLGVRIEDQAIDHCIHLRGLELMPLERCRLPSPEHEIIPACDLELGHISDVHSSVVRYADILPHERDRARDLGLVDGERQSFTVDLEMRACHQLRQEKRAAFAIAGDNFLLAPSSGPKRRVRRRR